MQNKSFSFQAALLLVLCAIAIAGGVRASQIPLGLDGRKQIFVQEYWLDGSPSYCVSNAGNVDQVIQISRWQSRTLPPLLLNEWDAPADSVRCHDAGQYLGEWLLEFRLQQGDRLGLLKAPRQGENKAAISPAVASYQSLNVACGSSGLWMEQHKLWGKPGEPFSIVLHITSDNGKIEIEKMGMHGQLPALTLKKATSSNLPVDMDDTHVVIDTADSVEDAGAHSVYLLFEVPRVSEPTMFLISGRRQFSDQGWQCFLRGVLIEPLETSE